MSNEESEDETTHDNANHWLIIFSVTDYDTQEKTAQGAVVYAEDVETAKERAMKVVREVKGNETVLLIPSCVTKNFKFVGQDLKI